MPENRDCSSDAAAYSLGALDPSEAAGFRRHLDTCIVCRDEIAAFGEVADMLAIAAPEYPVPRRLRRKVMRDVRAEPGSVAPRTRRSWAHSLRSRRFPAQPALVGGLLAAAALAVVGGVELARDGSARVRVIQARVFAPVGSARLSVTGARAELVVNHLAPPPPGRIYEVWIDCDRHAPSPTALFSVTATGAAEVGVPGDVRGASTIMVTQERAGGSLAPTSPAVIVARLT